MRNPLRGLLMVIAAVARVPFSHELWPAARVNKGARTPAGAGSLFLFVTASFSYTAARFFLSASCQITEAPTMAIPARSVMVPGMIRQRPPTTARILWMGFMLVSI